MSNILKKLNVPVFGSSKEDTAVLEALRAFDNKVLSESSMRRASKNELINSLRHTKQIANKLGRIGLAFYVAWSQKTEMKPEELIRVAKASSRIYDPKALHD